MSNIYIITAVHDSLSHTIRFVECLKKQKTSLGRKIIITDDGSTDGTSKYLKSQKGIRVIRGNGNLWWTGGINLAIIEALKNAKDGDYLLTINNDCIFNSNFVEKLVSVSEENNRAIVGCIERNIEDRKTIISGLIKVDWKKGIFYESLDKKILQNIIDKNFFEGADTLQTKGTLIPIEVFKDIGLFDQKHFPHYASDYEFFIRAKNAGYNLLVANVNLYCDSKRTGISDNGNQLKVSEMIKLAFSKKSQINFVDHINLVKFCCPKKYKIRNYWLIIKKALYFLSRTFPLSIVRKLLLNERK